MIDLRIRDRASIRDARSKYSIRIGDLKPWHILRVKCFNCRHVANISPAPLLARFGTNERLTEIEERFACTECGNRWGNSAQVHEMAHGS